MLGTSPLDAMQFWLTITLLVVAFLGLLVVARRSAPFV
jgi:hypothetical protein